MASLVSNNNNNNKNNNNNNNNNSTVANGTPALQALEQLFSTRSLRVSVEDGLPVAVVAVQRYLSDKAIIRGDDRQQPDRPDSYRYDLTVTDGVRRTKCALHHSLNHLVRHNTLRAGREVRITGCSFVYNEQRLGHGYICVEEVQCAASGSRSPLLDGVEDLGRLPVLTRHGMENVGVGDDFPLTMSAQHYLPLWNNVDPEGEHWLPRRTTPDLILDVSKIILLCDLELSLGNTRGCLPILVRVIHKSRLRYYGKCAVTDVKKKVDFPYQAYFEVADQSGAMSLVLWNELCLDWYQSIQVGTVLHIHQYSIRDSYANRSRPQMDHHHLRLFRSKEISMNRRNTASVLTMVPQKNLPVQCGLPDVSYNFTCRSDLESLADNKACDVIGLVTFVGRVQRIRGQADMGPEKFWSYRWVHAVDDSSQRPFILEVFSNSQPDVFHSICPMSYLVLTQMRVCRGKGFSTPFLTSSCETDIFITGCHKGHKGQPYLSEPRVKDFIRWTKTLKDEAVLRRTAVGGHYCYPPAPPVLTQALESGSAPVPLVSVDDLKRALESLCYREHRRLAFQGLITSVRYVQRPPGDTQPSGGEKASAGPSEAPTERCVSEPEPNAVAGHSGNRTTNQTAPPVASTSSLSWTTPKKRSLHRSYMTRAKLRKRLAGGPATPEHDSSSESASESDPLAAGSPSQQASVESNPDSAAALKQPLQWDSSDWLRQRQEASTHLCGERLHQDSLTRRFSVEEQRDLLHWSGLPPSHWTSGHPSQTLPPVAWPGYYHTTILGINQQVTVDAAFCPVMSSEDPRAEGLPQDPHGNSLLSCLSTGFLCPLSDTMTPDLCPPSPEEILQTAGELEGVHFLCILDLCHLGVDRLEIVLHKVYRLA